jgi:hypothetical protein
MPTLFPYAEGNTQQGAKCEPWGDPARSKTLSMLGSHSRRSWEVSSMPDGVMSGGAGKGDRTPAIHVDEKSDAHIVPKKSPNKGQSSFSSGGSFAEEMEREGAQPKGTLRG